MVDVELPLVPVLDLLLLLLRCRHYPALGPSPRPEVRARGSQLFYRGYFSSYWLHRTSRCKWWFRSDLFSRRVAARSWGLTSNRTCSGNYARTPELSRAVAIVRTALEEVFSARAFGGGGDLIGNSYVPAFISHLLLLLAAAGSARTAPREFVICQYNVRNYLTKRLPDRSDLWHTRQARKRDRRDDPHHQGNQPGYPWSM
jgi:hypothetical protein